MPFAKLRIARKKGFRRLRNPRKAQLPAIDAKFNFSQLPPRIKRTYKRVSEIWGIPAEELMPVLLEWNTWLLSGHGQYSAETGTIKLSGDATWVLDHELLHGLHALLEPRGQGEKLARALGRWKDYDKKEQKKFKEKQTRHAYHYMSVFSPDYAILLIVSPPKRMGLPMLNAPKKGGFLPLFLWQAKMKKAGHIENGRLTQKGLSFLRGKIQRETILERLALQAKTREKAKK
jgi:hypothetical protein